jgi:hypothetical protein
VLEDNITGISYRAVTHFKNGVKLSGIILRR